MLRYVALLVLYALHGIFASGFIPLIYTYTRDQSALTFGGYFAGLVLGQLAVARFRWLLVSRWAYAVFEIAFGATLVAMALSFTWQPWSFVIGRLCEGLAAGVTLPLMFSAVVKLDGVGALPWRLSIFNSTFALGFVSGPLAMDLFLRWATPPMVLYAFGALFVAYGAWLGVLLDPAGTTDRPIATPGWFKTFFTLFLAKAFYGALLPYVTEHLAPRYPGLGVTRVMLVISGVFVLGQLAITQLVKWRDPRSLARVLSLLLAVTTALALWRAPELFFVGAFLHSCLLFVGYLALAGTPGDARTFAVLHSMSDPGMIAGAALAGFGANGLYGLCGLCLVNSMKDARQRE